VFYVSRGNIPHTRHTQHRQPDGSLYAEELFGMEGFTGRSSLLYHRVPPTQTHKIEAVRDIKNEIADDGVHRHRLVKTGAVPAKGNVVEARMPLFFNSDVLMGVVRPTDDAH
jgi:homogentisate 1,2-dioxygenase